MLVHHYPMRKFFANEFDTGCCIVVLALQLVFTVDIKPRKANRLQPMVLKNILQLTLKDFNGRVDAYEVGIKTEEGISLPCGAGGIFVNDGK